MSVKRLRHKSSTSKIRICYMKETDFAAWLEEQRQQRDMTQADLARASGLSTAHVSRLENRRSAPGPDALDAIARALKLPPPEVYRAAGLLPKRDLRSALIERIVHIVEQLPPEEQERFASLAEWTVEQQERRAKTDPNEAHS